MELTPLLKQYLLESRQIDALAVRQAAFICRAAEDVQSTDEIHLICLLVLALLRNGSPRGDLTALLLPLDREVVRLHAASWRVENNRDPDWISGLEAVLTQSKTMLAKLISDPARYAPVTGVLPSEGGSWPVLVVHRNLFGFSRYWRAARMLEQEYLPRLLKERAVPPATRSLQKALDHVFIQRSILDKDKCFHHRQIAAAALACRTRFCILSGGPGTGKTSVVLQILRTLLQVYPEISADRIVLCAPTGRAKARLGESIDHGLAALAIRNNGSGTAMDSRDTTLCAVHRKTIQSLLGQRPDGTFNYNRDKKLPHQVVVVDESSMVPLNLFTALLEACSDNCRLLLAGDMYQLPSVEAGAVLGDLTGSFSGVPGYPSLSAPVFSWVQEVTAGIAVDGNSNENNEMVLSGEDLEKTGSLTDHAIVLTNSYRSSKAILTLAEAVNDDDFPAAMAVLQDPACHGCISFSTETGITPVIKWIDERLHHGSVMDAYAVVTGRRVASEKATGLGEAARTLLLSSAVLTLTHEGVRGRKAINRHAEQLLRKKLHLSDTHTLFPGMPIILGTNHYDLDLYNGDLGIVISAPGEGLTAVFPRGSSFRAISLERLRNVEPAFALTVHKAQGSEFDNVLLVLPEQESPLLTRQIVYTGITRAKKQVKILGAEETLQKAIEHREVRVGGVEI